MSTAAPQRRGESQDDAFAASVLAGLGRSPKRLSSAWFYDRRGSELFEDITGLPEYYLTRTEIALFEARMAEMVEGVPPGAVVVEIGSGSSRKTPLLLQALGEPHAYVPVDLAAEFFLESAAALSGLFPGLRIQPVVADFTGPFALPADLAEGTQPRLGFFPGSTIGNLAPAEAAAFLRRMGRILGRGGRLLVGADCSKDPAVVLPAYDDAAGVTAEFNLNLLARINRELGADFDLAGFRHEARWCTSPDRVEMHLVSRRTQQVRVLGRSFRFAAGESIHTENCHKYGIAEFQALARRTGWRPEGCWTDGAERFSVHRLVA